MVQFPKVPFAWCLWCNGSTRGCGPLSTGSNPVRHPICHMFTGIIKEIGILKKAAKSGTSLSLKISSKKIKAKAGASISVNGACLTVTKKTKFGFEAEVMPETLRCTNLGKLHIGAQVNLEPSISAKDSFDGHFVTGHVDSSCKVLKTGSRLFIELPKKLAPFIAGKGSVAINGVSLTVAKVKKGNFEIALIPFTLKNTNLGKLKIGDYVNIEVDLIARYINRSLCKT